MLRSLKDVETEGKTVIVRVDFNVPLDSGGQVKKNGRIVATLPTINYLLENKCKIVLISHLGRPKGQVVERLRLNYVVKALEGLLNRKVLKLDDCIGENVSRAISEQGPGSVILLENLRFYPEEEANDEGFAKELASLGEVYVNDAFGVCHRNHASVVAITRFLPSCAGFLLEKEVTVLKNILENPARPFVAIVGGAKTSDKLKVLENLVDKADSVLVGGALAFTFLKAKGAKVGDSVVEEDLIEESKKIMESGKIVLPIDVVESPEISEDADRKIVDAMNIDEGCIGLDIGPETLKLFENYIKEAKSVMWNGPLGLYEMDEFAVGTKEIMRCLCESKASTVIGGGNTLLAAKDVHSEQNISHKSTGGGAMLKFLEGTPLPAIESLQQRTPF